MCVKLLTFIFLVSMVLAGSTSQGPNLPSQKNTIDYYNLKQYQVIKQQEDADISFYKNILNSIMLEIRHGKVSFL